MAKSDREKTQRGPENPPEPHGVNPDEAVLAGADSEDGASPSAAGPTLSVSADDLTLATPELAPAVISKDAAETAALDETAEEARAAADEAAEAGVLAAGPVPRNSPAVKATPSGTAPAGGAAGDTPGAADDGRGSAGDAAGTAAADAPDAPSAHPAGAAPEAPAGPGAGDSPKGMHGPAPRPATADPADTANESGSTDTSAASGPSDVPLNRGNTTGNTTDHTAGSDSESLVPVLSAAGGPGLYAGTDPAAVGTASAGPTAGSGSGVRTGSSAVSARNRTSLQAPPGGMPAGSPVSGPARSPWAPSGDEAPAVGPRRKRSLERREAKPRPLVPLALGAVAVLALLTWGIISVVRGLTDGGGDPQTVQIPTAAGADGVIAENVAPSVLTAGQCLLDFTGISNEVTIVTCTTPHRAQLIASEFYPDEAEFPGSDQLGARAKAACSAADINAAAAAGAGRIELLHVTPTEGTWADEDRRVDCFAVVEEGATLSRSLLNE